MKILLLKDWTGPTRDGGVYSHVAGETISCFHNPGARLVRHGIAKWVEAEEGDPAWEPVAAHRATSMKRNDKMVHSATNK